MHRNRVLVKEDFVVKKINTEINYFDKNLQLLFT